jgi:hypothetical protein
MRNFQFYSQISSIIYTIIYILTIQWPFFGKKNANRLFVNGKTIVVNKRINKIYLSYFKHSFDLKFYIIQIFFQHIMILPITFHLNIWIHVIYRHEIFINGSYIYICVCVFLN